jgi:hypothetical protein
MLATLTKWTADQRLLYHWYKYVQKNVTIVFPHHIENYGDTSVEGDGTGSVGLLARWTWRCCCWSPVLGRSCVPASHNDAASQNSLLAGLVQTSPHSLFRVHCGEREPISLCLSYFNFCVQQPNLYHHDSNTPGFPRRGTEEEFRVQFIVNQQVGMLRNTQGARCRNLTHALIAAVDWIGTLDTLNEEILPLGASLAKMNYTMSRSQRLESKL